MMSSIFGGLLLRGSELRIPPLPGEMCQHFPVASEAVAGGIITIMVAGGGVPFASGGCWRNITMRLTAR